MKQKTFRFFLDLMLLVCLALAGCGLPAYAQAQLSVSLLITPAFLLLAGGAFELGDGYKRQGYRRSDNTASAPFWHRTPARSAQRPLGLSHENPNASSGPAPLRCV